MTTASTPATPDRPSVAGDPSRPPLPPGGAWHLLVIGGGTAGIVGAKAAASLGASVLLVERHRIGGDCLWTGCVPSKALLAAASRAASAERPSFPDREWPGRSAAGDPPDMQMRAEIMVGVPADQAWALVGERFGDIGTWAAPITRSSLDAATGPGAVRTCHVRGFGPAPAGVVHERLITFDAAGRSLSYEADGLPRFIAGAVNRWSVTAQGEGACTVRAHATLTLRGPMRLLGWLVRSRLRASATAVLDELRHYLETGTPHPRKLAAATAGPGAGSATGDATVR